MASINLQHLVIATHNFKKALEMATILGNRFPSLEILTLVDFPGASEPDETGTTYQENAAIKARSAAAFTKQWCVADDAGLEIDALNGEPGLYSKRFAGEDTPFPEKISRILVALRDIPAEARTARFRCAVALSPPGGATAELFEATCEGVIAEQPSGEGGFGYDPIFFLPDLGCTMADLTPMQKHAVSHRGKVLAQLGDYLERAKK